MLRLIPRLLVAVLLLPTLACAGVCEDWNAIYTTIRDDQVVPAQAETAMRRLHAGLLKDYAGIGSQERVFPVRGYDAGWGEKGRNYEKGRYDFFGGNHRGLHPAHDLFIRDRNQDSLDDRTGKAVEVVAFSAGVVVAVNTVWDYPSPLKGGKYIWVFDPRTDRFCYYAHLDRVDVKLGEEVRAGQFLGLLGRTGKNAHMNRSPTHLHFMVLRYDRGRMTPVNPWQELLKARTLQAS